jgi:hypothetical protein
VVVRGEKLSDHPTKQFRRYRQVVGVTYLVIVGLATLYLMSSIVIALVGRHTSRLTRPAINEKPRPEEITACHDEVTRLFWDLNTRYFELPSEAARAPISVRERSREVQGAWQARWREVGQHCRFSELAGTGLGSGFDQLASIHNDLEELDIGYASLLSRFRRQLAPGVEEIRRNLEKSRQKLEDQRRRTGAPAVHQN